MYRRIASLIIAALLAGPTIAQDVDPDFVVDEAVFSLPSTLDPHLVFFPDWNRFWSACYETPLECDSGRDGLRISPRLLETLPVLSEDGLELTMTLRKGIRFQDDPCFEGGQGREATARDLVYVIYRHADPATASPFFASYLTGRIRGLDALRARSETEGYFDYDARIPGLTVTSSHGLKVALRAPYPQFLALMTMAWMSVVPREAVRRYGSGLGRHPVGTGAYRFDADQSDDKVMRFTRAPRYWDAPAGGKAGPLPWNSGVRFHLLPDTGIQEKRFREGDLSLLDLWPQNVDGFVTDRGRVRAKVRPRKSRLVKTDLARLHYIAFNMRNKILMKKEVRQALSLAVDRERIVREYYQGAAALADHVVPPSLPLDLPGPPRRWPYGAPDLKRARRLLAEAGYPDGLGLPEFLVECGDESELAKRELARLASDWERIGVRIQVRQQPFNDFIDRARKGLPEISINHWFADYPDPENFFLMLLSSCAPAPDRHMDSPNVGFYENAEYDRLYAQANVLLPGASRGKVYARMIEIIQEDCPWIFVAHQFQYALVAPGIEGIDTRSLYALDYRRARRLAPERAR